MQWVDHGVVLGVACYNNLFDHAIQALGLERWPSHHDARRQSDNPLFDFLWRLGSEEDRTVVVQPPKLISVPSRMIRASTVATAADAAG